MANDIWSVDISAQAVSSLGIMMNLDSLLLPPVVSPTVRGPDCGAQSGFAKRAAAKRLPRVFLVWNRGTAQCHGAILLVSAEQVDASLVRWSVGRVVKLAVPHAVRVAWSSTISHCDRSCESEIRLSPVLNGGRLHDHFLEYAESRWYLWPLSEGLSDVWASDSVGPHVFQTGNHMCRACGIVATNSRTKKLQIVLVLFMIIYL